MAVVPLDLVQNVHRRNTTFGFRAGSHSIEIETDDYPIEPDRVSFDGDVFPYIKLALLDMYIEQQLRQEA